MNEQGEDVNKTNRISRRTFFKIVGLTAAGTAAAMCGPKIYEKLTDPQLNEVENSYIKFGNPERISFENYGMKWMPDGQLPFVTFPDGEKVAFISANARSYPVLINKNITPKHIDKNGRAIPCIGPDPNEDYRNGYTSITSVFQLNNNNPDHLTAITHNEEWVKRHVSDNYTGSIGLAQSYDRGSTWTDIRQAIKASDAMKPGFKVTGVGQPSAILVDENGHKYIQVYYLYLPLNGRYLIHASRAPVAGNTVGEFEHFTSDGFKKDVEIFPDNVKPIILPPEEQKDSYTALPSISRHAGDYVGIFETQNGFCMTKSKNGISWNKPEIILKFPQGQYPHKMGDRWYSNPTFWSLNFDTSQEIGNSGLLLYSTGIWDKPHQLEMRSFRLK
jgi:hypothetical protein